MCNIFNIFCLVSIFKKKIVLYVDIIHRYRFMDGLKDIKI